jgi:hypothetical protein
MDNQVFCKQHVVEEYVNEEEDCVLGEDCTQFIEYAELANMRQSVTKSFLREHELFLFFS